MPLANGAVQYSAEGATSPWPTPAAESEANRGTGDSPIQQEEKM